MTAFLAGLAATRCMEHERASEIDGPARAVLSAMAWYAGEKDPRCTASHASIATRSGFDRRTVMRAQERLAAAGVIERVPTGPGLPAEWRLTLLAAEARSIEGVSESHTPPAPDLGQRVTPPVSESHTPCDSLSHNPSESSVALAEEDRGRSSTADATSSADAADVAAPLSMSPYAELLAEVAAWRARGLDDAEAWARRKIDGASTRVRDEVKFLRACLNNEREQPSSRKSEAAPPAAEVKRKSRPRPAAEAERPPARVRVVAPPPPPPVRSPEELARRAAEEERLRPGRERRAAEEERKRQERIAAFLARRERGATPASYYADVEVS